MPRKREAPEHYVWRSMIQRCSNPHRKDFSRYGGRGVRVCERWKSFANFFADMGARPSPKHSLDRIDNDGNYEPSNCRWATSAVQRNNTSYNVTLSFRGKTMTCMEWARELGMPWQTIYARLRHGWSAARALSEPNDRLVRNRGVYKRAAALGIPRNTVKARLYRGASIEEALRVAPRAQPASGTSSDR